MHGDENFSMTHIDETTGNDDCTRTENAASSFVLLTFISVLWHHFFSVLWIIFNQSIMWVDQKTTTVNPTQSVERQLALLCIVLAANVSFTVTTQASYYQPITQQSLVVLQLTAVSICHTCDLSSLVKHKRTKVSLWIGIKGQYRLSNNTGDSNSLPLVPSLLFSAFSLPRAWLCKYKATWEETCHPNICPAYKPPVTMTAGCGSDRP